jgi:hypothetical protein
VKDWAEKSLAGFGVNGQDIFAADGISPKSDYRQL